MSRRGWVLFLALSVIWGLPYLFIKIAVEDLSPSVVVWGRVALAAAVLLPVAATRGLFPALRPVLGWVVIFAVIEIAVPFLMLGWAETRVSSSLAALLVAGVPIVAAVMARGLGIDDRLTGMRVVGLVIGIVGVGFLVGLDVRGGQWWAVAAVGLTVVGYALGPIIIATRLAEAPSLAVITVALGLNTLWYAPVAWVQRPTQPVPAQAWWAIAILGVVCTALAFLIFFQLVAEVGPSRMTVITYLNPAVAVLLGVVVLSEPITAGILIGFPLVLIGSWLATRRAAPLEDEPHP